MIIKQLQDKKYKFINLNSDKSPKDGNNWKENHCEFDEYKSGNVGIIAGHNDLRIIDIDIKKKDGQGNYYVVQEWVDQANEFIELYVKTFGPTLIVKTPSGGYHIYLHSLYDLPDNAYIKIGRASCRERV